MILDRVTITREFTKEGKKPITFKLQYLTEDGLKTIEFTTHEDESDYVEKAMIDSLNNLESYHLVIHKDKYGYVISLENLENGRTVLSYPKELDECELQSEISCLVTRAMDSKK